MDANQLEYIVQRLQKLDDGKSSKGDEHYDGYNKLTFEEEWRIAAMTLDRILQVVFMIIFLIGTVACFSNTKYIV